MEHNLFIEILENNNKAFNEVFEYITLSDVSIDGPFYKFLMNEKLIKKMRFVMNKLKKNNNYKTNLYLIITNIYKKMIQHVQDIIGEYHNMTTFDNNIDIYMNDNAGFQLNLDYYIVVNEKIINHIVTKYKEQDSVEQEQKVTDLNVVEPTVVEPTVVESTIIEPIAIQDQSSYVSNILSYFGY